MMQFPRYESYKDSGVEWLGEIPSHWEIKSLRSILENRNEKNSPIKTKDILSLSIANGVTPYSDENRGGNKAKSDLTAYKLAYPQDIVLNSMNVIVGAVGLSKYFGAISPVYYALHVKNKEEADIYYYDVIFSNTNFQKSLHQYGKGILIKKSDSGKLNTIRMKISIQDLKKVSLPFPPINEQQKIVNFLDKKTAEIEEAIAKKQKLIELLQEQKTILINRAVTKGLDPNVTMCDSGIEWIGEIPEHWEVMQVRRSLKKLEQGNSPTILNRDEEDKDNFYVLKISAIKNSEFFGNEKKPISYKSFSSQYQINQGDILLTRGNTPELVADSCYIDQVIEENVIMSDLIYRLTFNQKLITHKYANYFFKTKIARHQIRVCARGSSQSMVKISQEHIKSWLIFKPPIEEQKNIVDYISKVNLRFKNAALIIEREIDKIKEFKQILISNAVTGKIKI